MFEGGYKVLDNIKLQYVHFMPEKLESGILYVSKEFGVAIHLCPCGCENQVVTPLNKWTFTEDTNGPTLYPSVGNFQLDCKSHYFIKDGKIKWC
jgi:hypothetical protein